MYIFYVWWGCALHVGRVDYILGRSGEFRVQGLECRDLGKSA